ncbi:hypothetical protein E2Y33_23855 [Salmonella enterica]|nr:hypothetical protein [Salmonella enterica]ECK3304581.1 hypothetical protein [Salmonella enterica]ECO6894748.1 hypothetical protein [Salmonella enterica]ECP5162708.1 hypothetical protein [Salmonella enterica]
MLYQKPWFRRNDKSCRWRHAKRPERRRYSGQKTICENYRCCNVNHHYTWRIRLVQNRYCCNAAVHVNCGD